MPNEDNIKKFGCNVQVKANVSDEGNMDDVEFDIDGPDACKKVIGEKLQENKNNKPEKNKSKSNNKKRKSLFI